MAQQRCPRGVGSMDLGGARADPEVPRFSPDGRRHEEVVDKVAWLTFLADAPSIQSMFSDDTQGNTSQSRSKPNATNMTQILQTRP